MFVGFIFYEENMYYKKWSFAVVPNIDKLSWKDALLQILYVWMCKYANEDGICYPSIHKLSTNCWLSRDTITRKIKDMEELGILVRERRFEDWQEKTSKYVIDYEWGVSAQLGDPSAQTDTELNLFTKYIGEKVDIFDLLWEDFDKYKNQASCFWYMVDLWYNVEYDRVKLIECFDWIRDKADLYWYRMADWSFNRNLVKQKFDKWSMYHKHKKDRIDNFKLSVIRFLDPSNDFKWKQKK